MNYYTRLTVTCDESFTEILIAELSNAGFDTFEETETGFEAYTEGESYDLEQIEGIQTQYASATPLNFQFDQIEKKNWNEEWENSYEPIVVDERCRIRAHFHTPDPSYQYEIEITPKMSFGTGHHQTTCLMIKNQLDLDHQNKKVMDAGCGTAVLSVMASKLGASFVDAFDIDDWSTENGYENLEVNQIDNVRIRIGTVKTLTFESPFDIILANINKNVLLDEMHFYSQLLNPKGHLLLSGFYETDIPDLLKEAHRYGFQEIHRKSMEGWSSLLLQKIN
jgi:ribosomal protein L11 methyltransferase